MVLVKEEVIGFQKDVKSISLSTLDRILIKDKGFQKDVKSISLSTNWV